MPALVSGLDGALQSLVQLAYNDALAPVFATLVGVKTSVPMALVRRTRMSSAMAAPSNYPTAAEPVHALKGISLDFRESEFVAVLGQSGCGKTTLLNIIGGLDRYTAGDLVIDGRSTSEYTDADWDSYRNHSVGFVFQSYNLIGHQSVLSNVEMALKLSGESAATRREKATSALEQVGLGDQLDKKPAMGLFMRCLILSC